MFETVYQQLVACAPFNVCPTLQTVDSTKINTFLDCPRQYFFTYVLGWRSDRPNNHLVFGQAWHEAMEHLDTRERRIINMRFFECKTQMETAEEIGISQAQVSRLEKNALKSMKKYLS